MDPPDKDIGAANVTQVVTFGAALPSGLFIPSLVVGAAFGRMLGTMMRALQHTRVHGPAWRALT